MSEISQILNWAHVVGAVEFCAPHGTEFKCPCFGFSLDGKLPKWVGNRNTPSRDVSTF